MRRKRDQGRAICSSTYQLILEWVDHNELLIVKRRTEEEFYVIVNSKEYEIDTVLPMDGEFVNLVDGNKIHKYIHMGRLGFMILRTGKEKRCI